MNRRSLHLSSYDGKLPTSSTPILTIIIVLMTFYSLAGCNSVDTSMLAKTTPTASPTSEYSSWKVAWEDNFDGTKGSPPDANKWTADVDGHGWGNKELEYFTDNKNAYLDGKSNLVIEARKENPKKLRCWYGPCRYTSARITTRDHFSFTYGLVVARIKIPFGQGIWPAFWLLGSNCDTVGWPACGEIDVMENIGQKEMATIHGSTHGGSEESSQPYTLPKGSFADDYHTFGVQWGPDTISFSVDNVEYATLHKSSLKNPKNWVYNHPFNIILNLSVGGTWPGSPDSTTVFPARMYVSFVKLYVKK